MVFVQIVASSFDVLWPSHSIGNGYWCEQTINFEVFNFVCCLLWSVSDVALTLQLVFSPLALLFL